MWNVEYYELFSYLTIIFTVSYEKSINGIITKTLEYVDGIVMLLEINNDV